MNLDNRSIMIDGHDHHYVSKWLKESNISIEDLSFVTYFGPDKTSLIITGNFPDEESLVLFKLKFC